MLSLALVTGNNPLIIDQSEDDLDNRYIYDQVVRQLADVANRRQVIVATHNPNIPILGDAEMIMALDATVDQSTMVACGAIDEPQVADAARQILEGGDKAFQDRARRYRAAR
jgi:chromosome segregation protein